MNEISISMNCTLHSTKVPYLQSTVSYLSIPSPLSLQHLPRETQSGFSLLPGISYSPAQDSFRTDSVLFYTPPHTIGAR